MCRRGFPNEPIASIHVPMNQVVAHCGNLLPGDVRVQFLEIVRDMVSRLTDDLYEPLRSSPEAKVLSGRILLQRNARNHRHCLPPRVNHV